MAGNQKFEAELYDCTLRDGLQDERVSMSLDSKIALARRLDEVPGLIDYIEGGYPGSNPKDKEFFRRLQKEPLKNIKLTAFTATRYKSTYASKDRGIRAALEAGTDIITVYGKSWDFQVKKVLKTSLDDNLKMIYDSVSYLKKKGKTVFFDSEHFFNGCVGNPGKHLKGNKRYALETLVAAAEAGADRIILCETNGGVFIPFYPDLLEGVVTYLRGRQINTPLGIHAHNDGNTATANTIYVVNKLRGLGEKIVQVHGCWNRFGERAGNADLCSIIAQLDHNLGIKFPEKTLSQLKNISRFVYELAGVLPEDKQPFVGDALGHKGGAHISAVSKTKDAYEYFDLEKYGNPTQIVISDQAGRAGILRKCESLGIDMKGYEKRFLNYIKKLECEGYYFREAHASFYLHAIRELAHYKKEQYPQLFRLGDYCVHNRKSGNKRPTSMAALKIFVNGDEIDKIKNKKGPINALDSALKDTLKEKYPYISDLILTDYKTTDVEPKKGAAAIVRVTIKTKDKLGHEWVTVGASDDFIEAAYLGLVDAYEFGVKMYAPKQLLIPRH